MKVKVYSIYDVKTQFYGSPVTFHNDSHAKRDITMKLSPQSAIKMYPNDYELFCLGTFDDSNGKIEMAFGKPVRVGYMAEIFKEINPSTEVKENGN